MDARLVPAVDVGGSHVKLLASNETERRRFDSGADPPARADGRGRPRAGRRRLTVAMQPDDVVIGGGEVDELDELPEGCRRWANENAFLGGFRLWVPEWNVPRPGPEGV